jgi:hypothetical protein
MAPGKNTKMSPATTSTHKMTVSHQLNLLLVQRFHQGNGFWLSFGLIVPTVASQVSIDGSVDSDPPALRLASVSASPHQVSMVSAETFKFQYHHNQHSRLRRLTHPAGN